MKRSQKTLLAVMGVLLGGWFVVARAQQNIKPRIFPRVHPVLPSGCRPFSRC